jgi:hypothetical protein
MKRAISLAALALAASPLAMAAPETRAPTAPEAQSFDAYYRQQFPQAQPATPAFTVSRPGPGAVWTLTASVDAPPAHDLLALCRSSRSQFTYNGRWTATAPRQFAWLQRGACVAPPQPVELKQPMASTKVIALLERQAALLQSARIMLSGNTSCARQRSYRYVLTGLDAGTAGPSPGLSAGLVYTSDHGTQATVWVRRSGLDFIAWAVSCP